MKTYHRKGTEWANIGHEICATTPAGRKWARENGYVLTPARLLQAENPAYMEHMPEHSAEHLMSM